MSSTLTEGVRIRDSAAPHGQTSSYHCEVSQIKLSLALLPPHFILKSWTQGS